MTNVFDQVRVSLGPHGLSISSIFAAQSLFDQASHMLLTFSMLEIKFIP